MTTPPKNRYLQGTTGVFALAEVTPVGVTSFNLGIKDKERLIEFRTVLRRSLNTWDGPPAWLLELADLVESQLPDTPQPGGMQAAQTDGDISPP